LAWRDVSMPTAIARMCELLFDAVHAGVRWAARCLADGEIVRTRRIVTRITMILRHVLLMIAVRLEVKPRPGAATPPPLQSACQVAGGDGGAPRFSLWSLTPTASRHPEAAEPHSGSMVGRDWTLNASAALRLQGDGRWGEKTLHRKLAGIRAALENPLRYARKIARALCNDRYVFLAPRIPRSTPPSDEQEFWEERLAAADEANFQYHGYWRRRRDSS
jgi:hypothetical protein